MNRLILLIISLLQITGVCSGQSKIDNYFNSFRTGNLVKAKQEIDAAVNDENLKKLSTTWYYRGELYLALYNKDDSEYEDALEIAYISLIKAITVDPKQEFLKNITSQLVILSGSFCKKGMKDYAGQNYANAYMAFERAVDISKMPMIMKTDTLVLYNAALTAQLSKNYDKAIKHYEKLISVNCKMPEIYSNLGDIYRLQQNPDLSIETYKKGIEMDPRSSKDVYIRLIKHYLSNGSSTEALKFINQGIQYYPQEGALYYLQANLYNLLKQEDNAINAYKNSVKYDPSNFEANYNLGIMLYNKGIKHMMAAESFASTDINKYRSEKDVYLENITAAAPYLESAVQIVANSKNAMLCLLDIYKRLQRNEKYNALKTKLDAIK